jgi:GH25 family lysozyme M1 (1,4-beta-N-acetylmuramidase)
MFEGIDISEFNNINWDSYKNLNFVIIRAGYGRYENQKDKLFEQHYSNAKNRNIPKGCYWYSYAKSVSEAIEEANVCLKIIKGKQFEYPIYIDVEEKTQFALGKEMVSSIIKAFCETVEKAGYCVGFYCNLNFYNNVVSDDIKKRFTCWLAQWDVNTPSVSVPMWQYHVDSVDHDKCSVDFPKIIKERHLNGFRPETKKIKVTIEFDDHKYSGLLEG